VEPLRPSFRRGAGGNTAKLGGIEVSRTEQAKATVLRLVEEVIDSGNVELIDELLDADFVDHADYLVEVGTAKPGDRQAFKQMVAMHIEAISDLRLDVTEVLAENDHVMLRGTLSGRHTGTLYGIPASDNDVAIGVSEIFRVGDGKIVEHWWCRDDRILYRQIGALPAVIVARIAARTSARQVA
jgi:predicted ester cyclase